MDRRNAKAILSLLIGLGAFLGGCANMAYAPPTEAERAEMARRIEQQSP